jgi:hypothetical protein
MYLHTKIYLDIFFICAFCINLEGVDKVQISYRLQSAEVEIL